MGDDLRVVNSARVSFDKESEWGEVYSIPDCNDPDGLPFISEMLSEKDIKLLNYLAKHGHWTPFSHVQITMRETVPIFIARQRFKHMVGFTYNEVSRRYVDSPPEFYTPDVWRKAADNKKQGSSDEEVTHFDMFNTEQIDDMLARQKSGSLTREYLEDFSKASIKDHYDTWMAQAKHHYDHLIEAGVAPEQARMVLPQSMYTSYYVTGSLAAWARAYKQRIDPHAQREIQDLAKQWRVIIKGVPELKHSWSALTE